MPFINNLREGVAIDLPHNMDDSELRRSRDLASVTSENIHHILLVAFGWSNALQLEVQLRGWGI